jgi:hypothetical protein
VEAAFETPRVLAPWHVGVFPPRRRRANQAGTGRWTRSRGRGRRAILVFEIGGRRFGLPAAEVRELLRAVTILPLPLAPDVVEGIINVRGTVVPVLDIRARLRLPAKAAEPSDHLIVVEPGGRPVVLRIDRALNWRTWTRPRSGRPASCRAGPTTPRWRSSPTGWCPCSTCAPSCRRPRRPPSASSPGPRGPPKRRATAVTRTWSHPSYEEVVHLLGTRTGLSFSPERRAGVEQGIRRAMGRAGVDDPAQYGRRVAGDDAALDDLIVELTVGETYFFREPAQFEFLRATVLPEIRGRRGEGHVLHAWSAACASGEEAYSLAIVLRRRGWSGAAACWRRTSRGRRWRRRGAPSTAPGRCAARPRRPPGPTCTPRGATSSSPRRCAAASGSSTSTWRWTSTRAWRRAPGGWT